MQTFHHTNDRSINKTCCQRLSCLAGLAGGIIHELHNALGSISSNTKALRLTRSQQNAEHLAYMQHAIDRMQLMAHMLALYTRDTAVELQPVAVRPILAQTVATLQSTTDFQDIAFNWEHTPHQHHVAHTNADLLQKALEALLRNACESLGSEKRMISISLGNGEPEESQNAKVILGCPHANTTYLRCRIEDSGCGIPAGNLPLIFDPFYTTKMRAKGLGLAYVVGLVQQTNCVLLCQTSVKKGSVFTLCMPTDAKPSL